MSLRCHRFQAMGVAVECLVSGAEPSAVVVEEEFERLEQVFSRFRPSSELSRLNAAGDMRCSRDMVAVLARAIAARDDSGGRFDPTVHDALVAAGYDRTFADLPEDSYGAAAPAACGGPIDIDGCHVRLGPGVRVDLGGIAKGFAAERACALLHDATGSPCLVNAGGDIAVRGIPPEGTWAIEVEPLTVGLTRGGLATSGRDYRRWRRNGVAQHHLIDPATGEPSRSDLLRVTAVGADAVEAEVHAKTLFLAGEQQATRLGIPALLVTGDGRAVLTGGLA